MMVVYVVIERVNEMPHAPEMEEVIVKAAFSDRMAAYKFARQVAQQKYHDTDVVALELDKEAAA